MVSLLIIVSCFNTVIVSFAEAHLGQKIGLKRGTQKTRAVKTRDQIKTLKYGFEDNFFILVLFRCLYSSQKNRETVIKLETIERTSKNDFIDMLMVFRDHENTA